MESVIAKRLFDNSIGRCGMGQSVELRIRNVDVNPWVAHAAVGAPLADAIPARRDLVDGLGERAEPVDAAAEHLDLDMARATAADLAPQFFAEVDAVVIVAAHHPSLII